MWEKWILKLICIKYIKNIKYKYYIMQKTLNQILERLDNFDKNFKNIENTLERFDERFDILEINQKKILNNQKQIISQNEDFKYNINNLNEQINI